MIQQKPPLTIEDAQQLPEMSNAQVLVKRLTREIKGTHAIHTFLDKDERVMHVVETKEGYFKRRML